MFSSYIYHLSCKSYVILYNEYNLFYQLVYYDNTSEVLLQP